MSPCFNYFLVLVSRRDYSVGELTKKAKEKGFVSDDIAASIEELQNLGYQSDRRLVENLILSSQDKYGKPVLKRKCWEKGISAEIFEEIWSELTAEMPADESPQLGELRAKIMRKYKILDFGNLDPKTKAKIINYLQYRGFNPFQLLKQWQEETLT